MLTEALTRANLEDTAHIGQLIAAAEIPDREDLPYHPAIVEAMKAGRFIPAFTTFLALEDLLADVLPPNFENQYEEALLHARHVTESSILLQHRLQHHGLSVPQFSKRLYEEGITSRTGEALAAGTIHQWCAATRAIPSTIVSGVDRLLPPTHSSLTFANLQGHQKPSPDALLAKAAANKDIHRIFRYIRRALHFSERRMAREISAYLSQPICDRTVRNWELLEGNPSATLPHRHTFGEENVVSVYCSILRAYGHESWADQQEGHIAQCLDAMIERRHSGGNMINYSRRLALRGAPHERAYPY